MYILDQLKEHSQPYKLVAHGFDSCRSVVFLELMAAIDTVLPQDPVYDFILDNNKKFIKAHFCTRMQSQDSSAAFDIVNQQILYVTLFLY